MSSDNNDVGPQPSRVMTKEMIEKIKAQLDSMEGKEILEGGDIELKNEDESFDVAGWYIAYRTMA